MQQLQCRGRDASYITVVINFDEMLQILFENVHILEESTFKDFWLPVTYENWKQTTDVITRLYYKYICSNIPKTENSYQRINPAILWFLNTTSYQSQIVLACFIYKMAFNNRIDYEICCDNCMYEREETRQIPIFKSYNMTVRPSIIYVSIIEYSDILVSSKRQRLHIENPL